MRPATLSAEVLEMPADLGPLAGFGLISVAILIAIARPETRSLHRGWWANAFSVMGRE